MRARKCELLELLESAPGAKPPIYARAGVSRCSENVQRNAMACDRVLDSSQRLQIAPGKGEAFSRDFAWIKLSVSHFNIRKFPEAAIHDASGAPSHKVPTACTKSERDKVADGMPWARRQFREISDSPLLESEAARPDRTELAIRLTRSANSCPEFHERLIEMRAIGCAIDLMKGRAAHQSFGPLPQQAAGFLLTWIRFNGEQSRQHTNHISVENGRGLIESDAANSPSRVAPNSGQCQYVFELVWKGACPFMNDDLRRPMQVPRPSVVPKPFPQLQHAVQGRRSQRLDVGKCFHPALPVWNHRLDLRLLEHDFGDRYRIWISRAAPGKIARIGRKPIQERADDGI